MSLVLKEREALVRVTGSFRHSSGGPMKRPRMGKEIKMSLNIAEALEGQGKVKILKRGPLGQPEQAPALERVERREAEMKLVSPQHTALSAEMQLDEDLLRKQINLAELAELEPDTPTREGLEQAIASKKFGDKLAYAQRNGIANEGTDVQQRLEEALETLLPEEASQDLEAGEEKEEEASQPAGPPVSLDEEE